MIPSAIDEVEVSLRTIALKEPFITALGRKDATTNAFVRVRLAGGAEGWGEASGSVVMAHQKPARLAAVLRALGRRLRGADAARTGPLAADVWAYAGETPAAAAAFECAALDAFLRLKRVPMDAWFGGALERIETDFTLSAAAPETAAASAARAAREGFRKLKIKVGGGSPAADFRRVVLAEAAAHAELGRRPEILLDGNQGLSERGSLALVERCLKRGLRVTLLEQPLPKDDLKGMARLQRRCPVPLAADESVRSPQDALRVMDLGAADVINVKVAKTGLQASLDIIALARAAGKRLMIGCMQESALGLAHSVRLACGSGAFSFADLDSDHLLVPEQPRGDFRRDGGWLTLGSRTR
ncbi:MAG TPA: dipeptide epimerase [Elusimicrobia bacterium]|nr:dipeptide epimerase [Elusimicrobiota bacterium]